jgi:hypothetical protein
MYLIKPDKIITRRSQANLIAQIIALRNQIIELRRSGKIITQEQNQLRQSLNA